MFSTKKVIWSLFFGLSLFFGVAAAFDDDVYADDVTPGVDARVSRISFIRGDVQIRREGSQDWEKAVLNLPIVEGDEILTETNGRLEIQLGVFTHVRLAESSYLRVVGLKDGAVALSLSEGSMTATLVKFAKDEGFFEVDAPKTTVAIQKPGVYRIDAGRPGLTTDVRVTVPDEGEARVYSDNSGFTLRDGRSATLKIDGPLAGEWETLDASLSVDEFDSWALERDEIIAKRIKDAYYDKYYDRDIYGAEDLNDNGEWIYLRKHGHVWRPYRSAIGSYTNWSPYRYGHWRWVPPFGWTWINDEPWAWATYHHGRWFFDAGHWYWSPYGYVRTNRSWWYPALVGVRIVNQSIYWYPLPTGYGYFNYNHCFGGWGGPRGGPRGNNGGHNNGGNGGNNGGNGGNNGGNGGNGGGPVATPTPAAYVGPLAGQVGPSVFTNNDSRQTWRMTPPLLRVPPGAVVGTSLSSFGRDKNGFVPVTDSDARVALSKPLGENTRVRILPTYQELDGKVGAAIRSAKPRMTAAITKPTGAAIRAENGGAMDATLRNTKIFGGRDPIRPEVNTSSPAGAPRKTGAVRRDPIRAEVDAPVKQERETPQIKPSRSWEDPIRVEPPRPISKPRDNRVSDPIRVEAPRQPESKPRREVPVRQPRYDPPPTRSEPVRSEPVRNSPPPSKSEPTRSSPPPSKSEPSQPSPSKKGRDPID